MTSITIKQQLKRLIIHDAFLNDSQVPPQKVHHKYRLDLQRKKSINARKTLTKRVNKTLEIILRWHHARQSRGSRAHVNKGKPAGTKRPAVTGYDCSRTLQLNNLLLN